MCCVDKDGPVFECPRRAVYRYWTDERSRLNQLTPHLKPWEDVLMR
jgi:hypothetical protein